MMCDSLNVQKIKIEVVLRPESLPTVAYVTIGLWDLKIKGFRLVKKDDVVFLTPPSYGNRRGGYTPYVFLEDKEKWKQLETRILGEYESAQAPAENDPFA